MWVITQSINEYSQYGEYFVAVYINKPSFHDLKTLLSVEGTAGDLFINHLLSGGGRQSFEREWYYLTEIKEGELYNPFNSSI